jgi:hypothetical protein
MERRVARQPDLFATQGDIFAMPKDDPNWSLACEMEEHPGEEFIDRIRQDLHRMLDRARVANGLPWKDLTETYAMEMKMNSMSRWLPRHEARVLRKQFAAAMDRIYELLDIERPEVAGWDF